MERWHQRIRSRPVEQGSDHDELDFYLAFFQSSCALQDWFIESAVVDKADTDGLIEADRSTRLCRDFSNRSKHFRLRRKPSVDADFSILREYRGEDRPLSIIAGEEKRDLWDVADGCIRFWQAFIRDRGIPDPPSPFAR
jgi:hypothetical protein